VSKPTRPPRPRPARTPPTKRAGSAVGWARWLLLAVVVVLGLVAVVWLTGRQDSGSGQPAAGGTRAVGEAAPPVRLAATTGQTVDVTTFRGKRNVLLYFYEHAG
jgi:cytochrome oxidase Cu insertion factor (SCO1/SenC/PrrC family)